MTATIRQIEDGIATALETIDGLRTVEYLPDSFTPPVALIGIGEVSYHQASMRGTVEHELAIMIIVARSSERSAQEQLDAYRSASGASSVVVAVEADGTLGGIVDDLIIDTSSPGKAISINGASYVAVDFAGRVFA